MTAGPVPLRVVEPAAPDQRMLDMLDDVRARVLAGELNFLGVVMSYAGGGGHVSSGWVNCESAPRFQVLGAITAMQIDYGTSVAAP